MTRKRALSSTRHPPVIRAAGETMMEPAAGEHDTPPEAGDLNDADVVTALAGSLEKVQELLFGTRSRALEHSIRALDERQLRDLRTLQIELEQRLDRLHAHLLRELSVHAELIAVERQERAEVLSDVRRELRETLRGFERRVEKFEESTVAAQRELRERLFTQAGTFMDEQRKLREELAASTALEVGGLRAAKADRSTLARLLAEVAERLEADPPEETRGYDLH